MKWLKDRITNIVLIYINFLFAFTLMKKVLLINNFSYTYITILFCIGVFIYWFFSYILDNKNKRIIAIVIILGILLLIYIRFKEQIVELVKINYISKLNEIISLSDKLKDTYFQQYICFINIAVPVLIPIIIGINYRINGFVILANFIYIVNVWFLGYIKAVKSSIYMYIIITILTYLCFLRKYEINNLEKEGIDTSGIKKKYKLNLIYILMICFIISSIVIKLPQDISGKFEGKNTNKYVNKFSPYKKIKSKKVEKKGYNLSKSGYSNSEKELGGTVRIDNTTALFIKGDSIKYLKGTAKNEYTGYSWKKTDEESYSKKESGTQIKVTNIPSKYIQKSARVYVYPKIKTNTVFVPSFSYNVREATGNIYYDHTPVFISSEEQTGEYYVDFYKTNFEEYRRRNNDSSNILQYNLGYMSYEKNNNGDRVFIRSREETEYIQNNFLNLDTTPVEEFYKKYLQVPNSVPKEVFELVYEITEGSKNNYEKVEKIKKYLEKNYSYSLQVDDVPKNKDFLYDFLFQEKKGYCTYFATATTIMCRIAGVPSRYVEGFKIDKPMDVNSYTRITNENAHAWSEVLVDSYNNIWSAVDPAPTPLEQRRTTNEENKSITNQTENKFKKENIIKQDINQEHKTKESEPKLLKNKCKYYIGSLLIVLFIAIIRIIGILKEKKYILKNKSIIPIYKYCKIRLQTIGINIPENQGDLEFVNKLKNDKLKCVLLKLVKIYYEEYYGEKLNKSEDKKIIYNEIENQIRQRQNIFKYFWYKYIQRKLIK